MKTRAVILDRDGVINKYPGDRLYVTSARKFKFLPGAQSALRILYQKGYKIFVASNQAGVGKGTYSQGTLDLITAKMLKEVEESGGLITKVYYCTHRSQDKCLCRKPLPGLLKKAAREYKFNLKKTYFIGDTIRDVQTAKAAGAKSMLLLCGREKAANKKNWETAPDLVFKNLLDAAKYLVK